MTLAHDVSMNFPKLLAAAFVVTAAGCDGIRFDLDSVDLQKPDRDTAAVDLGRADAGPDDAGVDDAGSDDDVDVPSDMAPPDASSPDDMAPPTDAADDMARDMGPACGIEHPIDEQRCNPTQLGLCPENGICTLAIVGGPPPVLTCIPDNGSRTLAEGDECSGNDCSAGLTCVNWGLLEPDPRGRVCSRFCELDTNEGCADGQFCTANEQLPPMDGIGVCRESCDPYDPASCPEGSCSVDYNYPASTCLPNFRCVEPGPGAVGDECGPSPSESASCGDGLVCYEVDIADFRCVEPCQADGDCGTGACSDPYGTYGLSHCQLP